MVWPGSGATAGGNQLPETDSGAGIGWLIRHRTMTPVSKFEFAADRTTCRNTVARRWRKQRAWHAKAWRQGRAGIRLCISWVRMSIIAALATDSGRPRRLTIPIGLSLSG
jgi:hypothetical protein